MRFPFSLVSLGVRCLREFSGIGYAEVYHASWWYQDTAPGGAPLGAW